MAVSLYFGLPGCGKTTMLAKLAIEGVNGGRYLHVYSNVGVAYPGVTLIDNDCIGQYELRDCLVLIDEATLFADSRAWKEFGKSRLAYFLEHRHRNADIVLFTQQWDGVDRKIRTITDRVYYIKKGVLTGKWFSSCYRIPYDIIIPDPKRNGGEKLGDIIQGYCKPSIIARLFARRIYRPKYYKYFDSWELEPLPDLPAAYKPFEKKLATFPNMIRWCNKRLILLRSVSPNITGRCTASLPPLRHLSPSLTTPDIARYQLGSFINIYDRPIALKQTRAHPIHNTDQPVNEPRYPLNGHSVTDHSDIRRSLIHHFPRGLSLSKLPWCRSRSRVIIVCIRGISWEHPF